MNHFKKPLLITAVSAGLVAILGAGLGWFSVGNELYKSIVDTELAKKENLSFMISALALILFAVSAVLKKHRLAFLVLPVALFGLVMVINQKPDAAIVSQLDITVKAGYWLSMLGMLVSAVVSGIIGVKGFDLFARRTTSSETA